MLVTVTANKLATVNRLQSVITHVTIRWLFNTGHNKMNR